MRYIHIDVTVALSKDRVLARGWSGSWTLARAGRVDHKKKTIKLSKLSPLEPLTSLTPEY